MPNVLSDLTLQSDLLLGSNNIALTGNVASASARSNVGYFNTIDVLNPPLTKGKTDGSAYPSGYVGETISSYTWPSGDNISSSVNISVGSPAVITYSNHGLSTGVGVNFTSSGTLPSGITAGVNYYVIVRDANSFWIATSVANALNSVRVGTSGTQSGTHTCNVHVICSGIYTDANGLALSAGLWAVNASVSINVTGGGNLTVFGGQASLISATSQPFGNTGFTIFGGQAVTFGLFPTGTRILNLTSPTIVYGTIRASYSSGGAKGCCSMVANRIG